MKMRSIIAAAALFAAVPAIAEEQKTNKIDPQKAGPTEAVSDKVPEMKSEGAAAPDATRPATESVGDAVPDMKADDKNMKADDKNATPPATGDAAKTPDAAKPADGAAPAK